MWITPVDNLVKPKTPPQTKRGNGQTREHWGPSVQVGTLCAGEAWGAGVGQGACGAELGWSAELAGERAGPGG